MAINKITSADLANKGVIGLPDIPALTTSAMQAKFEETVRDVAIPKINEIIENVPTKTEVTAEINEKVTEIGAGDMSMAVYDINADGIVNHADLADNATTATNADNSTKWNNYNIQVVTELPSNPSSTTFYVIVE